MKEAREASRRSWRKIVISLVVVFACSFFLSSIWEPVIGTHSVAGQIGLGIIGILFMVSWLLLLIGVPWLVSTVGKPAIVGWAVAFLVLLFVAAFPQ